MLCGQRRLGGPLLRFNAVPHRPSADDDRDSGDNDTTDSTNHRGEIRCRHGCENGSTVFRPSGIRGT